MAVKLVAVWAVGRAVALPVGTLGAAVEAALQAAGARSAAREAGAHHGNSRCNHS